MSDRFAGYERLVKGGFGCSSLWLGEDHLLYVEGFGLFLPVSERYRRYAYTDIDSVVVATTSIKTLATLWYALAAVVSGVSLAVIAVDSEQPAYRWIFVGIATGALIASLFFLVRHLRRGASCVCELSTPVSRVQPRPLRRLETTLPALDELRERIVSARKNSASDPSLSASATTLDPVAPIRPQLSAWAPASFLLHLLSAVWMMLVIALGWDGTVAAVLTSLLVFSALTTLSLSLAAATRTPVPMEAGLQLWALLGPLALLAAVGLACYSVFSFQRPELISGPFGFAQMLGSVSTELPNSVTAFLLLLCLALAVLSIVGWRFSTPRWVNSGVEG